jgi:lysophospholipase L1-like esterase
MKSFIWILVLLSISPAYAADLARYESSVKAYEDADKLAFPPAGGIVVIGSSTITMWSTIKADLAPLNIIPRGIGGSNIDEVDYYLDRMVLAYKPRTVVIYEGDNDLAEGKTPQYIAGRFADVTARIHARLPSARVYVISVKPSMSRWSLWESCKQLNLLLQAWTRSDSRLAYIEAASALLGADGMPIASYYAEDRLHLSSTGYQAWTKAIRPQLIALESRKCAVCGGQQEHSLGARRVVARPADRRPHVFS